MPDITVLGMAGDGGTVDIGLQALSGALERTEKSIEVARLAVQTRCWNLYEIVNGDIKITYPVPKPKEVALYLKGQKRFSGISEEELKSVQVDVDKEYERLLTSQK